MEEIAFLAFLSLAGFENIASYQSYSSQLDLVISGSSALWYEFIIYLHLLPQMRTIVIEAKNIERPIGDNVFSRLCSILQNKFNGTSQLGIFFTRNGATGFPREGQRQRALRDARATQMLFYARTDKYVIVLTNEDIQQLDKQGALPRILEKKIRDINEARGLSFEYTDGYPEIDLPPHMQKYSKVLNQKA